MLAILKRAVAHRMALAQTVLGGYTIWIEHIGEQIAIECIAGEETDSGKAQMGLLRNEVRDLSVIVSLALLPEGYVFEESKRFLGEPSGDLTKAKSYRVDSVTSQGSIAGYVKVSGTRGK